MNSLFTEEQLLLQAAAREFAEKELQPRAARIDQEAVFPEEAMKMLAELEMTGIPYPQEYGGGGADMISYALILEELAKQCEATALTLSSHTMAAAPILTFGAKEQITRFVPALNSLRKIGAFALTEAGAGSDAGGIVTSAVLDGDDYVINGTKIFITNGDKCDIVLLFARTDPASKGNKGLSAFIVEKKVSDFEVGKHEDKMGIRGSHTTELIFRNCRVPKENLLGKPGEGLKIALTTLVGGRIAIAAQAVGVAQACLDESINYAKERHQFGRPLASNQAIQWMIADMAKDVAAARLLTHHAAKLFDLGEPCGTQASIAKLFASEAAMNHAIKAVQIHGGYGYVRGTKVERLFRDVKVMEIFEGTSEVHRMIISGSLIK
ncbi:MAG: acyl-CoA dehydrogenase family protein [Gracilibacteraceae bacterium]|jgi:butyryl-CoA dehydrogenase|nr:acyl-CoA dehydrogenase family protein [Gracilibacteraceae bacterium]